MRRLFAVDQHGPTGRNHFMQNNQGRGWTPTKLIIVGLIGVFAWGWCSDYFKEKRQESPNLAGYGV